MLNEAEVVVSLNWKKFFPLHKERTS